MAGSKKFDPSKVDELSGLPAQTADKLGSDLSGFSLPTRLGDSGLPQQAAPTLRDQWDHQQEVRSNSTGLDQAAAVLRQDGFIASGVDKAKEWLQYGKGSKSLAGLVGYTHMDPDANWKPADHWDTYGHGIPTEFKDEFEQEYMNSTSESHAASIRSRMDTKLADLDVLASMNARENILRTTAGFLAPEQMVMGLATGGASELVAGARGLATVTKAAEAAKTASKLVDPALRSAGLEKAAAAMEEAAQRGSTKAAAATGLAAGGGTGAVFETLRQSVNFENDHDRILESTLMSVAFSAPFVGLGIHSMNKLSATAGMERQVLGTLRKVEKGETVSEADTQQLREYGYHIEKLKQEAQGHPDPVESPFDKRMAEIKERQKAARENPWGMKQEPLETSPEPIREDGQNHDGININEEHIAPEEPLQPPKEEQPVPPPDEPHVPPVEEPQAPKEGFHKFWETQDKPIGVRDEVVLTHTETGDSVAGEVMKVSDTGILVKDHDGKVRKINPQEYTLDSHDLRVGATKEELGAGSKPPESAPEKPPVPFDKPPVEGEQKSPKIKRGDIIQGGIKPESYPPGVKPGIGKEKWFDRLVKSFNSKGKDKKLVEVKAHAVLKDLHERFKATSYGPVIKSMLKHPELSTRIFLHQDHVALDTEGIGGVHWGRNMNMMAVFVRDIKKMSDSEARAFIHEYTHAHLQEALSGGLDHVLTAEQRASVAELKALHKFAEEHMIKTEGITRTKNKGAGYTHYSGDHYGFTDVDEFTSELFANESFQRKLATIPYKNENVLTHLWKSVKKILGLGKEADASALGAAFTHTEKILGVRIQPLVEANAVHFQGADVGISTKAGVHAIPVQKDVPTGPSVMGFITINGKKVPIRWDISQTLDNSTNPTVRQMGFDMVKNAIGWAGDRAQGITITERKERIKRNVAGKCHYDMRDALNEAIKVSGKNFYQRAKEGFVENFYKEATMYARGDSEALTRNPETAKQLEKAAGALRTYYSTMANRAASSGLKGAEHLPGSNENYINRSYLYHKITEAVDTHGLEAVHALFASSFKNPKIKGDMKVAGEFVAAIRQLEYKTNMSDLLLNAKNLDELRDTLQKHGLSDPQINSIADVMFDIKEAEGATDKGVASNLKHRMDLDETASVKTGGGTLKMSDLVECDARKLVDKYTSSMGGYIAAAEHGWTDPVTDFSQKLTEADNWVRDNQQGHDINKHNSDKELMQSIFNEITGKPWSGQTGGRFYRFAGALRAASRSVFLGELGIASAMELKNSMALCAYHGAWSQMPSFGKLIGMLRKGIPVEDQLAKDVQHIAGFGNEFAMQYAAQHEITDYSYGHSTSVFEKWANRAAHAVDNISGNATMTSATRNLSAKMVSQHLYDIGRGSKAMDKGFEDRLVHNGIDRASIKETLQHLTDHSISDSRGVLQQIDWEGWQQANPKTYNNFSLALERFTRDGIQDHNVGETMPWMHTETGKIMAELRTFMLVGHSKQFLKNAHYHDRTAAVVFMTSFIGECLAYSVQSSLNYAHDPAALSKRLSADAIAKAAIGRMGTLGILPSVLDTPFKAVTGHSMLTSTNNTDNRDLLMTPSMMLIKRIVGSTQTAFNAVSPLSDTSATKQEVKEMLGVLPGSNTYGVRNIVDFVSSHFPKADPARQQHQ